VPRRIPYFRPNAPAPTRAPAEKERTKFYSSARWMRLRKAFLAEHPLCVRCETEGRLVPATIVHHIRERLERPDLALDPANLLSMCDKCHSSLHKSKGQATG
jgi:5-methylcytosine-specific restriction protein A